MDLPTATTAFATIVSLIADFKAHRDASQSADYEEFARYLATNRHEDVLGLLNRNTEIGLAIKSLLKEDREVLRERFDRLDTTLASIASRMEGFGPLVEALHPNATVSAQAASILKQFKAAGASRALESSAHGRGSIYLWLDGISGQLHDLPGFFGPMISRKMAPNPRGAHEKESIHRGADGRGPARGRPDHGG